MKLICVLALLLHCSFGISRPEVFCEKGVLKNFAKFPGKHMCHSLFFNKVAGLLWRRCFPVNFAKSLRTPFFHRIPLVAASSVVSITNVISIILYSKYDFE